MFFDPKDPRYNHCTVKEIEHLREIMQTGIEKIDLSLNRSLEELISSYFEAHGAGVDSDEDYTEEEKDDYHVLENYLADMGAI